MKCVIIEDEDYAAIFLESLIRECVGDVEIQARLDTVEDAVRWLSQNETDLIFLDIHLGDGASFGIFDHVQLNTPIIFTTSYDKYAIKAFEQNSIAYLMKPIKKAELARALSKYELLYKPSPETLARISSHHAEYQSKFMVYSGNTFLTLTWSDIAYFHLQNKRYLFITTKDKRQFMYNSSLELLEKRLDPGYFFRINRQYIVNKDIIVQSEIKDRGRALLHTNPECKEELVVSIGRAKEFKDWMGR
jgi:two-component system, LytTR family, response regulator LytT